MQQKSSHDNNYNIRTILQSFVDSIIVAIQEASETFDEPANAKRVESLEDQIARVNKAGT